MVAEKGDIYKNINSTIGTLVTQFGENYGGKYFFPSDDIDEESKDAGWHLAWCQAIFSLLSSGGCYDNTDDYKKLELLRLYGEGRQPNGIYQNLLLGSEDINPERKGWLSTNWEILSPAPKIHREIRGRFEVQEYDIVATAIDPNSVSEKEDKAWEVWYNSKYGNDEDRLMEVLGNEKDTSPMYIAQSLEELDIAKGLGVFKLKSEVYQENLLEATEYLSDMKIIKEKVIKDLVNWNRAAFRDYYDPSTGVVGYEYVDWRNLVIDYSNETDFKDIRFWGYVKFETINNVRVNAQDLEEHDLINMAKQNAGLWGNIDRGALDRYSNNLYRTENGIRVYDQFRVPIFICEWISTDTEYKTIKNNKAGEKKIYKKTFSEYQRMDETNKKKTQISRKNNIYQASWIIGSKYIYDYGKSLNSYRKNYKEPRLSIHAVSINGKSITEEIKPNLDQIELAFLRWESAIAQAKPSGLDWDLTELENISLGGSKLNLKELIQLARQTGDTIRRSTNLTNGKESFKGKAVNRNEGGIGEFLNEILMTISKHYQLIADNTGVDVLGSTLSSPTQTTATQVKYASASTSDALQPLYTSWVKIRESASRSASYKIQRALRYSKDSREFYTSVLGEVAVNTIAMAGGKSMAEYGIKLELRSTEELKKAAIEAATRALSPGKNGENINLPDWWYFVSMINNGKAKQAMSLLRYRIDKSKQEALEMQDRNMEANGRNMVSQAQAKTQGNIMEIQAKNEGDIKEVAIKALLQMEIDEKSELSALKKDIIGKLLLGGNEGNEGANNMQNELAPTSEELEQ